MLNRDFAAAADALAAGAQTAILDGAQVSTRWRVERWDAEQTEWARRRTLAAPGAADFARLRQKPYAASEVAGNLVTTVGLNRLTSLLIAGGGQAITNTSARIGAGNGAGTAVVGSIDLSASAGSSNRWFQVMDATYPQQSNGLLTLRSTFGSGDGNFAWNEFGIDVGTPTVSSGNTVAAVLFNHKTSIAQGTKASGQTWTVTATVTFS